MGLAFVAAAAAMAMGGSIGPVSRAAEQPLRVHSEALRVPLSFESNVGQTNRAVDYLARGSGYTVFLTSREAVVALRAARGKRAVMRVRLRGASAAHSRPLDRLPGTVNYFIGNRVGRWRTGVPTFARVMYPDVYPGIDVVYYGNQRRLEYDFHVSPGSDPRRIRVSFAGADAVRLGDRGELLVEVDGRQLRQPPPRAWQDGDGRRRPVRVRYEVRRGGIGFRLAGYDPSKPVVIDPVLAYSTYLGGIGEDAGNAIAVDGDGNAYVAGTTASADFPTANAYSTTPDEAFVTKLNASGTALVYSTYLGGSWGGDSARGIAVDTAGGAYVTGWTNSPDFPTVNAFQSVLKGPKDAFVTKLSPTGSSLSYSTYLGGSDGVIGFGSADDEGHAITVDAAGSAYVSGLTQSRDFPTLNPVQAAPNGNEYSIVDAFVTKFQPSGNALAYSTFLGGTYREEGFGIAVDSDGRAVVVGRTYSDDFPVANALRTSASSIEGFVTKLNATGDRFVYSTYLGGALDDEAYAVASDAAGNAFVTGLTESNDFPTTPGAFDARCGASNYCSHLNQDAFVTRIAADGSALGYSTFLGADGQDHANAVAVDSTGSATVAGTSTGDFPLVDAVQPSFGGGSFDGFVTRLDPAGSSLVHSTYLGGNWYDVPLGIATGMRAGDVHVTGRTLSTNFITTPGAFDRTGGNTCEPVACHDAFVVKLESGATVPDTTPPAVSLTAPADGAVVRGVVRLAATASDDTSVRQLEFRVNGNTAGFDPYPPHESDWISSAIADGPATITATASDPAGNTTTSEPHAVIVDNHVPETTIISAPNSTVASDTATFHFSADEFSTFECSVDGAPLTACSSPATYTGLVDGAHTFAVRAIDSAGNREAAPAIWTWSVDVTAPETRIVSGPASPTNQATATFSFDASDTGSTFECARDSGDFWPCTSPVAYTDLPTGEHTFRVRARDLAGNSDASPAAFTWTVDVTAPETEIAAPPPPLTNETSASFSPVSEPTAGFECSLDGSAFASCASPVLYSGLSAGGHTFAVRAVDAAGNADPTPASYHWTIDRTPPETTIGSGPQAFSGSRDAVFVFSVDDGGARLECSLDEAPFESCSSPRQYADLADGEHVFAVRAVDAAGNVEPAPSLHEWTVDLAPPDTTITAGPPAETRATSASFSFVTDEEGATFQCALDGGQYAPCATPAQYTGLSAGSHVFGVRAIDRAGNTDPEPATRGWAITDPDVAPPVVSMAAPAATTPVRGDVELTAEATDDVAVSAVEFVVGGAVVATDVTEPYAATWNTHSAAEGPVVVFARASDTSGNSGASVEHRVTVDNEAPETRIDSGPASTTTDVLAAFAFSASELGTSFECSLDGEIFSPCFSPTWRTVALGAHTFTTRARDAAGNLDLTPATWMWTVLAAPPPPPPPPPLPPPLPPPFPPTPPQTQPARCVVPNVRGKTLQRAKATLRSRRCATGRITYVYHRTIKKGRVIAQSRRPGMRHPRSTKVHLRVSKGRRSN